MKTINQVLLALIFSAFSIGGFAQNSTILPSTTQRDVDRVNATILMLDEYQDDEDDEDDKPLENDDFLIKRECKTCYVSYNNTGNSNSNPNSQFAPQFIRIED